MKCISSIPKAARRVTAVVAAASVAGLIATTAAFDLQACSHAGPVYLGVEPLQPGVGTINS